MKKTATRFLVLLLALTMFGLTGCGTPAETTVPTLEQNVNAYEYDFDFDIPDATVTTKPYEEWDTSVDTETNVTTDGQVSVEGYGLVRSNVVSSDTDKVRYVMIYNPEVYQESNLVNSSMETGSIAGQVDVDLDRGGLEEVPENMSVSQDQLQELPFEGRLEGDRAGSLAPVYKEGDKRDFYCSDKNNLNSARISRTFTCRYAGTYCNIWVADVKLSDSIVSKYGKEFDTYIYEAVVGAFGTGRFTENGGKVNLLYYPLPEGIGGFFCTWDLYASSEVTSAQITKYGLNTDHAIVHINGKYADYKKYSNLKTFMFSVMAHEFQHLICATDAFENSSFTLCDTWINEAMSGYIEESLYEGVKENSSGHMTSFYQSDLIRNGQSLYNFTNQGNDIGVYGSVYLYSTYVAHLAGDDVFSNFHSNWRNSTDRYPSVAKALVQSVPAETYNMVDSAIPYPDTLRFGSTEERWMSKLTLSFYLELLARDDTDPASFAKVKTKKLLYDEVNSASIEGGGRIIIALSGDEYVIPDNADSGLIYVGLNKDFEVVTPLIYK